MNYELPSELLIAFMVPDKRNSCVSKEMNIYFFPDASHALKILADFTVKYKVCLGYFLFLW